jgi:uncharacterized SAM-binding protein YcdF (DUF218 family)
MTSHDATTRTADMGQCALMIGSLIPFVGSKSMDALVVLPGLGQRERLSEAMKLAELFRVSTFIYPGMNETEMHAFGPASREELLAFPEMQAPLARGMKVEMRVNAVHTPDQAAFTMPFLQANGLKSCILAAPGWHLVRAYLTFVKVAVQREIFIPVYPYPTASFVPIQPVNKDHVASGYLTLASAAQAELDRCVRYMDHVASLEELNIYLQRAGMTNT